MARRIRFVAFVLGVSVFIAWQAWPTGGGSDRAGGTGATGQGPASVTPGASPTANPTIVPGQTPIEHVVFVVKENRTFNNYFATYPGAIGATEGGTIRCSVDGCRDGPTVELHRAR